MTKLSVNLNKIALLRNARGGNYPDLLEFARRCLGVGVDGLTVHPRPDERHIRSRDVHELATLLADHAGVEFNIEGNPTAPFMSLVLAVKPDQCTLVPDDPGQLTSDHGWDAINRTGELRPVVSRLQDAGIRVSVFMDPDIAQIEAVHSSGADRIELYTEAYARSFDGPDRVSVLEQYRRATVAAQRLGLGINAGHDLNLRNLPSFLTIEHILEVSIGHAIVVESFDFGYENTLKQYLNIVRRED